MAQRRHARTILGLMVALALAGLLALAFRPRPALVDLGLVARGPLEVSIREEGRTRVHDAFVVSTPVAGLLQRVEVLPGDAVTAGETVVARMRPINPEALDLRAREQARALVTAAEAGLRLAAADMNAALAARDLALADLERMARLTQTGAVAEAALDRARSAARTAVAAVDTAEAAVALRQAELENARARLIGADDPQAAPGATPEILLRAPADGRILRLFQTSETTLPAGAPVVEIGDIAADLEVVVDLLSADAVQVAPGDRVAIEDWGGPGALPAEVLRVEPFGVTRVSALGVEEQRVTAVIGFTGPAQDRAPLGHGFRVEARIVVDETPDALLVPSAALFREAGHWAVFVAEAGRARLRQVSLGLQNDSHAVVAAGLTEGERVVLYPVAGLGDGARVAGRGG